MSTTSSIWIKDDNADKKYRGIYCHWAGSPHDNGMTLIKHYSDPVKLNELINLGAISSLGKKVNPAEGSKHSFKTPEEDVTVAYHRDRGERKKIITAETEDEFINWCKQYDYTYMYDMQTNEWCFSDYPTTMTDFEYLEEVLEMI